MAIGDATKFAAVAHVGLWHCASALDVRSHGRYRGKSRLGRFAKNDLDDPTATWAAHFIPLIWCRRFPAPPNGTLWNAGSDHSGLMLANLITFAHFSTSAARESDFKLPTPGLVDPFLGIFASRSSNSDGAISLHHNEQPGRPIFHPISSDIFAWCLQADQRAYLRQRHKEIEEPIWGP